MKDLYESINSDAPHQHQHLHQQGQQESPEQEDLQTEEGESRDCFGEVYLSVDMEDSEDASSEIFITQVSQVLGRKTTTKRKQEEAFDTSPPPQHHQAEVNRSPKSKKERPHEVEESSERMLQTSSPKNKQKRETIKQNEPQDEKIKAETSKSAGSCGPSGGQQHPSPMSRVTRLEPSVRAKVAPNGYPDNQHSKNKNCGCHTCVRELAVIKCQPLDPKGSFTAQFKDCVGHLKIQSHTDPDSHPASCLCKTHLERGWSSSSSGNIIVPSSQPAVKKISGVVSNIMKKLEPSRAKEAIRLPPQTASAGGRASGTSRTVHAEYKRRNSITNTGKREDPRTGKPPPPPPRKPKPVQVEKTTTSTDSGESEFASIPVHTTR